MCCGLPPVLLGPHVNISRNLDIKYGNCIYLIYQIYVFISENSYIPKIHLSKYGYWLPSGNLTLERSTMFQWINPLFLWSCSIAMSAITRGRGYIWGSLEIPISICISSKTMPCPSARGGDTHAHQQASTCINISIYTVYIYISL